MLIKSNTDEQKTLDVEYVRLYDWIDRKFGIPIFQRLYVWDKETARPLIEDVITSLHEPNKDFYLFDFIYYDEEGMIKLADGQQRLISLNILMQAINDLIDEKELPIQKIKLFDIKYDITEFEEKYKTSFESYPIAPFKKIYSFFKDDYLVPNLDNLENIIKIIKEKIFVFMKRCTSIDDAFEIFNALNNGGKKLKKDDVMKTAINQYSSIYNVEIKYTSKSLTEVITSYYKFITKDTAGDFTNLSILNFIRDNITKTKEMFKSFVNVYNTVKNLTKNPFYSIFSFIQRTSLIDILNILALKGVDISAETSYVEKIIIPLCLTSINMKFKKVSPTDMRYLISDIIKDIKEGKTVDEISLTIGTFIDDHGSSIIMSLDEYTDKIGSLEIGEGIKKSLIILDIIYRHVSSSIKMDKINLEHIYPKKPKSDWAEKGWPASGDSQKILINDVGNYLILCESVNKAIKNKYIADKVPEYKKIIEKDRGLITEMNTVDFDKFEIEKASYIKERREQIAKLVRELPYGSKLIYLAD